MAEASRRSFLSLLAGVAATGTSTGTATRSVAAVDVPDERLARLSRALNRYRQDEEKVLHSQRGYYDDDGVRQGGLIAFVRYFWRILEPETPFVDGWVLWAMCEHLEAVTAGKITRLLINV